MIDRLKSKTAIATVASLVAALGVGGVAVAQNNSGNSTPPAMTKSAPDDVQSGDRSGSDKETNDGASDKETNDGASDKETNDGSASEQAGEQSGSEVPGDDGPGGHADEPGNANAGHQETGQE